MRAAIYVRLSRETEATVSPETQLKACKRLCEERGWSVVEEYQDIDWSGGTTDRPALRRLRGELDSFDALIFYKVDRLSRSVLDFHTLMQEADAADVALVSATEPLDLTTPMGRAFVTILATFAELERETIRARVMAGRETLQSRGRWPGGARPFGWEPVPHLDGAGSWLALHPEEAPKLREAVEKVLAGGSIADAARVLETSDQSAAYQLRSPRLVGHATKDGAVIRGEDGLPVLSNEPIVSVLEWQRLQDAVGQPVQRRQKRSRLLSGLLSCGTCGSTLHASNGGPGKGYRANYRCQSKACAGKASMTAARLEAIVEERFLKTVGRAEVTHLVELVDQTQEERSRLELALDDLALEMASGALTATGYAKAVSAVEARLSAIGEPGEEGPTAVPTGQTYEQVWQASDDTERSSVLAAALETIRIAPGRYNYEERTELVWRS